MKSFAVIALLVAGASASVIRIENGLSFLRAEPFVQEVVEFGPTLVAKHIPITSYSHDIRGALSSQLEYSTGHGIRVSDNTEAVLGRGSMYEDESGRMVESGSTLFKTGSYSYTSPEGIPISLSYTADEHGFRADGAHLPKQVDFTPEVLLAAAEHADAHRLALSKVSTSGSYGSYDASPALFVKSSGYEAAPVIRVGSYDAPAPILFKSSGY